MSLCYYNTSIKCKGDYKDCTDCVLDKLRAEIEKQEKWLAEAGYNAYNVDIAFGSIIRALPNFNESIFEEITGIKIDEQAVV